MIKYLTIILDWIGLRFGQQFDKQKMEKQDKQNIQGEFIYPVAFEDFVGFRKKQSEAVISGYNIKELNKLRKLKKMLEVTEQKICNRIKLFKKVSMVLQRKKQKQHILHERAENLKKSQLEECIRNDAKYGYMRATKSSASLQRIRQQSEAERQESSVKKIEAIQQQKTDHAKQIKMWKQRNKIMVEQRKFKQMREKVKSANIIRSNRNRAKQIKILCEQEKYEDARKIKQQKFKAEIEKYDELQSNLTRLQREQREALMMWKRAMESS